MNRRLVRPALLPACLPLLLAGCGGLNIWPFGSSGEVAPAAPPNSTEYRCTGGKGFYLRFLDKGAAWVILPEREFRLDALSSGPGTRFSNGIATLEINGNEATLTDGPSTTYGACTPVAAKGR